MLLVLVAAEGQAVNEEALPALFPPEASYDDYLLTTYLLLTAH